MIWELLQGLSLAVSVLFSVSYIVRAMVYHVTSSERLSWASELANNLWNELKYVYLIESVAGPFLDNAADGRAAGPWDYIASLIGAAIWWYFGKVFDDDDRWKKRKAKLTEKIERVGARLVVVPARG